MTPDEAANTFIREARARGWTRDETIAGLSTGRQESGWRMVWSPNRLWFGYFQQDGSYPNRMDPLGNIRGFLDKVDAKRTHPGWSNDMFANIFWVQQGPNWPSADHGLRVGRTEYYDEIRQHIGWATTFYDSHAPTSGGPMPISGDPVWLEEVWRKDLGDRLVVHDGWDKRGTGGFMGTIWGTMVHHTGNDNERVEVIRDGVLQPSGWLPGPLAQALITRDGKLHLIAVGPCNHAGAGNWKTLTNGNRDCIGIECCYDGDPLRWPDEVIITLRDACAAVSKHIGKSAADSVCGHKEYAKPQGRKIDPGYMDMDWFRGEVQKDIDGFVFPGEALTTPHPPVQPIDYQKEIWDQLRILWPQLGDRTLVDTVAAIGEKLGIEGCYDTKAKQ